MSTGGLGKVYANGEIIVRQGDPGDCMFAIQKGNVEVLKSGKQGDVPVAILKEGDIFGEMALFDREVRSATVRALGEARILTIDKRTFMRRVQDDPTLAFNLLHTMSLRIRNMTAANAELRSGDPASTEFAAALEKERRRLERRMAADRRKANRRVSLRRRKAATPKAA